MLGGLVAGMMICGILLLIVQSTAGAASLGVVTGLNAGKLSVSHHRPAASQDSLAREAAATGAAVGLLLKNAAGPVVATTLKLTLLTALFVAGWI